MYIDNDPDVRRGHFWLFGNWRTREELIDSLKDVLSIRLKVNREKARRLPKPAAE